VFKPKILEEGPLSIARQSCTGHAGNRILSEIGVSMGCVDGLACMDAPFEEGVDGGFLCVSF
jgi:hypothetical protein